MSVLVGWHLGILVVVVVIGILIVAAAGAGISVLVRAASRGGTDGGPQPPR
ncbi:MAG: hypothetical protein QM607_10245 [Microbacterium sp.]